MRRLIALSLSFLIASECYGLPGPTASNCHGGGSGAATTAACTATMTVTSGNVVYCIVAVGSNATLTSITTGAGTGAVTWTAVSTLGSFDSTNVEGILGGWGNVTGSGTITPTANFTSNSFRGIYCEEFNGSQAATDGSIATTSAGSSSANGVVSGNITTTANGDLLLGGTLQTDGTTATITAGSVSVAYTKLSCFTDSTNNLCMEWGVQTTAAASTAADWTYNAVHRACSNELAVKAASGAAATATSETLSLMGS